MKAAAGVCMCALSVATTFWSGDAAATGYFVSSRSSAEIYDATAEVGIQPWTHVVNDGYQIDTAVYNTSAATVNPGGFLDARYASSSSAADLSSGTLGAYGEVADFTDPEDPNIYVSARGTVMFGDSFTTSTQNGPFVWSSSDTVTFSMVLNGERVGDFSSEYNLHNWNTWQVSLAIWSPGSIGPGFSNDDYLLDIGWSESITPAGVSTIFDNTFRPNLIPVSFSHAGSLESGGVLLNASFNPGGDFDWSIGLSVGGSLSSGTGSLYSDMSHTLTVDYEGIAGTITQSGSGVFPGTVPVPEPGTHAMVLAGLGLVGRIARRRKQSC